ncbi:helix-turn-helix domain-containing protein [Peribacillus loiseleuriae]
MHEGLQHELKLYDKGDMTIKKICAITKLSKPTLYRALDKRKNRGYL